LHEGAGLTLPPEPARHAQVLRLQPGARVTLFGGDGVEWPAEITRMGRQEVDVVVLAALPPVARELPVAVTLAIGMPANERMDALVEKATELGVACIQPLQCARSVLKLSGERADKRQAHWQQVAISAAEQSGRTRVPEVAPVTSLDAWLGALRSVAEHPRHVLSFAIDAQPAAVALNDGAAARTLLSGPEGGLAPHEEDAARARGFTPLNLGPRVLRADTAPLAALAYLGLKG
jgi:16S rRNA (uracil1498-N3)-methyltransferase